MMFPNDSGRTQRHLRQVMLRYSDFALFRPSYPDGYTEAAGFADMVLCGNKYYFRGVERVRRRFRRDVWKDTGEIWKPGGGDFELLSESEALAVAELGAESLKSIVRGWARFRRRSERP